VIVVIEDMAGIWIDISSIRVVQVHGSRTSIWTWVVDGRGSRAR
jgi:hypothetical protein